MNVRSLACQVSALGLVIVTGGGLSAASAMANDPTSGDGFRVTKVSEDGSPLAGARYEAKFCFYDIYSAPEDRTWNCTTNDHWVSDAQGHLVLNDPSDPNDGIPFEQYPLVYGCSYCGDTSEITVVVGVREVEAPTGYDKDDGQYTYYPGYLEDGSDKWGHATANPGVDTGSATKISQGQLGDLGDLNRITSPDFNGYEALYVNKFTRSALDVRVKDEASGAAVPGGKYTVTVCSGDPETCTTLPHTYTAGADGLLRDENGRLLSSEVSPKLVESSRVTITQTEAAPGYGAVGPVVLTHTANTGGWSGPGGDVPTGPVDITAKATPVTPPPTTKPTTKPTSPTTPTTKPTTPTMGPTTPTTKPSSPTSTSTGPATVRPTSPSGGVSTSAGTSAHGQPSSSAKASGPVVNTDQLGQNKGLASLLAGVVLCGLVAAGVLGRRLVPAWRKSGRHSR